MLVLRVSYYPVHPPLREIPRGDVFSFWYEVSLFPFSLLPFVYPYNFLSHGISWETVFNISDFWLVPLLSTLWIFDRPVISS